MFIYRSKCYFPIPFDVYGWECTSFLYLLLWVRIPFKGYPPRMLFDVYLCDCVLISYTFLCLYSCHVFKCDWNLIFLFVFVKLNKNPLEIRMLCELNGLIIFTLNIFIDVIMMINRREQYNRLLWQSWPWSYGSWIYNYLCNQCLSPLMLWVRISIRTRCTTLFDKVCQWLGKGRWFSPVSSTNRTDRHDIAELLWH